MQLITDPDDTSLFNSNEDFIDSQYLLGHNTLVCPVLNPGMGTRDIYLPGPDQWYPSNLRVDVQGYGMDPLGLKHAAELEKPIAFVTPVYIRGGAIIPQIDVRQSIEENDLNPPTVHIYPGNQSTSYSMYLDDGVSRDSAPDYLPQYKSCHSHEDGPKEAKSKFREVKINQDTNNNADRVITLSHPWDGYNASSTAGDTYYLGIWAVKATAPTTPTQVSISFRDETGKDIEDGRLAANYDPNRAVLTVSVPVALVPSPAGPLFDSAPSACKYIAINITGLN